jgi:chemotaxis protein MotB
MNISRIHRTMMLSLAALLALGGLGVTGCVTQGKYDELMAKHTKLGGKLRESESQAAERQRRIAALDKEIAAVKAALAKVRRRLATTRENMSERLKRKQRELQRQTEELEAKMRELRKSRWALAELAKIKAEMRRQKELNDKLRRSFAKMITAGQLKLINRRGKLVIQMASQVLFKSGKARLTKKGKRALRGLAKVLRYINRHFQVGGHTDNVRTRTRKYKDNWDLSGERATVVVRLLRRYGVPGHRLSGAGFGEFDPVASNRRASGRALNRRIEITLLPAVNIKKFR